MTRRGPLVLAVAATAWWAWRHASSPTVRAWAPSHGDGQRAGPLTVRVLGNGNTAVVFLHGMMSSGDSFGTGFDVVARDHQMVIPDLLGFGRSIALERTSFGLADHLEALDSMFEALGLADARRTVCGHSMGGVLALHWAARHAPRVERVVTWGAPLHTSRETAQAAVDRMGPLERLFVLDTPLSRAACAWSCRHRTLTGWLAAATNPDMPIALARQSSLHTWPAFRGALEDLVLGSDWQPALDALQAQRVPIVLAHGARDRVADPSVNSELAACYFDVEATTHPTAAHDLPISEPAWCVRQLTGTPGATAPDHERTPYRTRVRRSTSRDRRR